jgi:hypothetical protein
MKEKLLKILDKYYPINWDDPDPTLENELDTLIFDEGSTFNPIEDDIEEVREGIMDTLREMNRERAYKIMMSKRVQHIDCDGFPGNYKHRND